MQAIRRTSKSTDLVLLIVLAVTMVGLEFVAARLAYETVGAVASAIYWAAIGANLLFIPIAFRSKLLATVGIVLLGLVLIPYQFVLGERLWRVQLEASRIVAFAYETRISTSSFPTSLVEYVFDDPATEPFIQEYRSDAAGKEFILCYSVGTESTSHCYSPQTGWTYYPD